MIERNNTPEAYARWVKENVIDPRGMAAMFRHIQAMQAQLPAMFAMMQDNPQPMGQQPSAGIPAMFSGAPMPKPRGGIQNKMGLGFKGMQAMVPKAPRAPGA